MNVTRELMDELATNLPENIKGCAVVYWEYDGGVQVAYNGERIPMTSVLDLVLQGCRVVVNNVSKPEPTSDPIAQSFKEMTKADMSVIEGGHGEAD